MDEQKFQALLGRLFKQDLSSGSEKFRDELLASCLEELGGDGVKGHDDLLGRELDMRDLDMLAAAGHPYLTQEKSGC